jgi:hypothetical protein
MFRPRPHGAIAVDPLAQVHISLEAMSTVRRTGARPLRPPFFVYRTPSARGHATETELYRSSLAIQTLYPLG